MPTPRRETGVTQSDGLAGRWLSLEDLGKLDFFKGGKSAAKFRSRLNATLEITPGQNEPWLKAAVWREYEKGDVICEAGAYGSTAFLIVEGTASVSLPERAAPQPIAGRTRHSLTRLQRMFGRRTQAARGAPDAAAVGEVSAYASVSCDRPPLPVTLAAGDVFGVDACINFYPREATVRAEEHCVVVEMLRSVLDTIRLAGAAADKIDAAYAVAAIRNQLSVSSVFRDLTGEQLDRLAQGAELLMNDSDAIHDDVIYTEGGPADAVYLVRAGTIKLSQQRAGGELIFSYYGRGTALRLRRTPAGSRSRQRSCCAARRTPARFPTSRSADRSHSVAAPPVKPAFPRRRAPSAAGTAACRSRDDDVYLVDLDSDNGTVLNGEPIREAIVTAGDVITIVDYIFEATAGGTRRDDGCRATHAGRDGHRPRQLRGRQDRDRATCGVRPKRMTGSSNLRRLRRRRSKRLRTNDRRPSRRWSRVWSSSTCTIRRTSC